MRRAAVPPDMSVGASSVLDEPQQGCGGRSRLAGVRVGRDAKEADRVLIDCDTCTVRGLACEDCVVTVLLRAPTGEDVDGVQPGGGPGAGPGVELDGAERAAIAVLAGSGLVPPLRMQRVG